MTTLRRTANRVSNYVRVPSVLDTQLFPVFTPTSPQFHVSRALQRISCQLFTSTHQRVTGSKQVTEIKSSDNACIRFSRLAKRARTNGSHAGCVRKSNGQAGRHSYHGITGIRSVVFLDAQCPVCFARGQSHESRYSPGRDTRPLLHHSPSFNVGF